MTIHNDTRVRKFSLIYHGNRFLIIGLSILGLVFDGYQTPDIYFGLSIVIWIYLPELEQIEKSVIDNVLFEVALKVLFFYIMFAAMIFKYVTFEGSDMSLLSEWILGSINIWLFFSILIMLVIMYKLINWLIKKIPPGI